MAASVRRLLPGVTLIAGIATAATVVASLSGSLSGLMVSVVLGAIVANVVGLPGAFRPGVTFGARNLLRAGVVLLGLRLSLDDLSKIGVPGVAGLVCVVLTTFIGTQLIARALRTDNDFGLLLGSGYAICGASAIAAVNGIVDADEEQTAYAIALVTLCGSLSIFVLHPVAHLLGLDAAQFGNWVGGAVHDVGQVVATASPSGDAALEAATVAKLTRVVMLAPIVAAVSLRLQRRRRLAGVGPREHSQPVVPLFVVGFLAAIVVRSTAGLSDGTLEHAALIEKMLLMLALAALGLGVRISRLRVLGPKPLLAGLLAWVLVAGVAYAETVVVGPR